MNLRATSLMALFISFGIVLPSHKSLVQGVSVHQGGCSALDKNKPPLFISFESLDEKAWAGDKYEKGALLRVNNNSNCTISFSAEVDEAPKLPHGFVVRNGKMVHDSNLKISSLINGQRVSLYYLTKYPNKKFWVMGGFGGDVLETVYLNGGDHVSFGVPLKNFQKGGEILLPYKYDWDEGEAAQIITEKDGYKQRYETVEHYLRFAPQQLP